MDIDEKRKHRKKKSDKNVLFNQHYTASNINSAFICFLRGKQIVRINIETIPILNNRDWMGCDYWKVIIIVFEYGKKTLEKEFSIEPCNFYDIELPISQSLKNDEDTIERIHRRHVLDRLKKTPIPNPIVIFDGKRWSSCSNPQQERIEKIIWDECLINVNRILFKTVFQAC